MAEELLNNSFSSQADQQVGPTPGPQPFNYENLFNTLNKGKGVVLPDGKVAKNAAELRDNLSIPKNAPEATPAYNEAVERQKDFFDVYQEPIKAFGILRSTEFSGVLQGQPRDFEKTAIKQKQEVSKILPPTSVVEKTPVANMIKQRVDNQVSAMQKAFDGVSNDQIEEMVYKAEVLGDDSASVIVKDKIVVPRLVYGELEEQEIGTPVEGGYQITYSDYKTYLKDVLGMRGEESRYDLPETERFLYESEELGASEPVNEIAQNTMNLKEMFIDKKASQKLEQNLIENSDYLSVLDTRSKSLLSEDEKKIADKTESIEKEVNDLFSEAFLSKYSSKEEATKAIQEKSDRIKILEAEAAQMRKGAGLAPNQLFNPISGKLEDATPEEKQNLDLGIQSATAKYFGGGTQTPLTRSSMINDRNLLWNKLDYLDEEIKNTEAEAKKLGFSLSKAGAFQQTTGLRSAGEIQKVKSLEKRFNNLLNERATNYGSLLTLNRAIYTNEDVFKKQSDALLRLAESLSEDLYVVNIFTDKNTVRSRVQQVNEMANYFNSKGVQLTPSQIAATEETLSESVSGSPGSLINLMVDVGLTSGLIGGVAKLATTNKYYDAAKLYMTTRAGRAGKFGVSLFERSLPTILQGAAFELADQSFTTGIAESISERGFDRFVGKGLEKFSGKYGKLTYSLGRWLSGISGEFLAEVSGEVANIMTENGYDLVGAFEDAYGKDVDQVTKSMAQLGLTVAFMAAPQNLGYLLKTDAKFREHIAQFGTNPVLEEVHMLIKNTIESTPRTAAGNKLGEQLYKNTPVDPLVFTPTEQGPELERLNVEQRAANNGEEFYLVENNGEVNTDIVYKVDATTGELMVKGFNPLVEGFTKASETLVNKVNEQSTTNGIISSDKATDIAARNLNVNKVTTKDGKVLYQAPGQSVEQFNQDRTKNINSTKTLAENRFAPFKELATSIMKTIFPGIKGEVTTQQAATYNSYRDKVRGQIKLNAGSFFADGMAILMPSGMNKVPKISDFVAPLLEAFSKTGRVIRVAEEGSTETSRSVSLNSVLDSIVSSEFFQEKFGDTADALNHAKTLLSDLLLNDKTIIENVLKDSTKVKDFLKFRENFNKFVAKNYTGAASYSSNQSFYRNQMPDTLIKSREEEFEMTKKEQKAEKEKRDDIGRVLSAAGIPVNAKNIESVRYLNGDVTAQQLLDAADVDTTGMSEADMEARANAEARDIDIRKFGEAVKNRKENEKRRKQNIKTLTNALSTKFGMNLFQSFRDSGLLNGLNVFSKRRTVARIMNRIIESAATREGVTAEQFLNDMLEFEKMKEEEFNNLYETNPNAKVYFQRIGEIGAQTNIEIQQNLDLAKRLEKEGKTEQEILESTGWFRAADGSFKYNYIQPRNTLNENIMKKLSEVTDFDSKLIPLQQVFSQGELFSIYPDLKDISVIFYSDADSKSIGDFDPITKDISVNLANAYSLFALERILSHEVQHAIQKIEGWQGGGQPEEFVDSKFEDINSYVDELVVSFKETGKVPADLNPMVVLAAKSFITGGKDGLFTSTVKQASEVSKVFNSLISKELTKEEAVQQLSPYTTLSESELSKVLDNVAEINPDYQHILTILDAINENSIYESLYGEREARGVENLSDVRLRMSLLQKFLNSLPKSDSYSEISNRINNLFSRYTQFLSDGKKAISEMSKIGLSDLESAHLNGIFVDDTFNKLANLPFSVYAISKKPILKSTKELVDSIITIKQDLAKEYYSILNDSVDLIKPSLISLTDNHMLNGEAPVFKTPFTQEPISRKKFDSDYNSYIKERNSVLEGQKTMQEQSSILFQGAKGAAVISDTKSIIYALTNPDVSTPIHEIVHIYEKYLTPEEKAQILEATGETEWSVNTSEYFARGFERFLYDGEAPSEGLIAMFNKFREWLLEIYNSLTSSEIDVKLTPQVKDIYAAMLGEPRVEQKVEPAMAAPQTFTNELSTFIGERRSQGLSDDQIYQGLLEAGFKLEDLEPFFDTATRRTVESNLDPDSPFRAESVMMADEASGNYVKRTADELLKEVNSMSAEEQEAVLDSIAENSMMDVAVYKLIQDIITKQQKGEDITSDYERLVAIGTNLGRALQRFTELRKRSMSLRTESLIRKFEQDKKRTIPQAIKERLKTISTQFDKKKEEYEKARQLAGENASAISPIDSRYTNMELFKKLERELEGLAETYAKLSAPYVDKASYSKTAKTLIQGNLLTPNSGMVNIAANTVKSILNVPVNIISSIISKFFPGTTSTYRGLGYYGAALKYGFMQGGRNAARIIRKGNIPETIQTLETQNGFNGFRSLSQLLGSLIDAARGESSEEIATKYGYSLNQAGKIPNKEKAIKAWEGIVGLPAELMFRFLGSADALFKNTAYFGALYEQAMIEVAAGRLDKSDVDNFIKLNSDFTNDVAKNEALRFVYANRTPVSKFIGGALNIKSTDNVFVKAGKLVGSGVIPYVNVPTNIISEYAQFMMPEYGGIMSSIYTKQALDSKKKMDSAKNPQNKLKAEAEMLTNRRRAEEAAARAAVGLGLSMLIKTFVDSGAISASAQDEDEKRKDFIYRFERPYSINLSLLERARKGESDGFWRPGDAIIDYRFLGVIGGMMFISAKEARNAEKEKRKETATASLWNQLDNIPLPNLKETLQYVIEQSFLRGLNQMMQAFDPRQADRGGVERAGTGLLTTLSAAILPNSFSIIDRMNRTYVPEFDSPYEWGEKIKYDFINKLKERWPFDDPNSLPAKVDPFGKRILQTPEDRNAFIYNTFDITKFTKALGGKGDITWEMLVMAVVKKGGDISAMPSNPSPEITPIAGPKYSMSQQEYEAYALALGEARRRIVNGFIQGTDIKEFISPDSELNKKTGPDLNTPLGYYLLGKTLSKLYSAGDAVLFNEKRAIISEQRRKLATERPEEFQALVEREKNSIYGEAISELYSDPELENYKQYLGNINLQAPSLENLEEIKFDFDKGKEILEMTKPNQGEEGVSGELTDFNKKWLESINKKKGIKK
jgi:hypothetical protein